MDYPNLTAEVLTKIVTGINVETRDFPLQAKFTGGALNVDSPGLFAKWDELQPLRTIVKAFESRGALATPTNPSGVLSRAQATVMSFKKRYLYPEDLDTLRAIGGGTADRDTALRNVDLMVGDMDRRYRREPLEFLIAGALQDNLSITVDGVTVTPDFRLAVGHDLTASTSWATVSTDIDADVETIKRLVMQDAGEIISQVECGRNLFPYFRKNTAVKSWLTNFVGADARFDRMVTGDTLNLFGLEWIVNRRGYLVSSTWTPYIPDDKCIFHPPVSNRWWQYHRGTVKYPTTVYGGVDSFGSTYEVAAWARVKDEPPSLCLYNRWAALPVLVFPSAVVNFDATP